MNRYSRQRGVTLVETVIAISVGVAIALLITTITLSGIKTVKHTKEFESMHANIAFVSDSFSRMMRQSLTFSVPEDDTLSVTLTDGDFTMSLEDGVITVNGESVTTNSVVVESLSFTPYERSVTLQAELRITTTEDKDLRRTIRTTIASRSAL